MDYSGPHRRRGAWSSLPGGGGNHSDYSGDSGSITHSCFARVCVSLNLNWLSHQFFHRMCFTILGLISSTSEGAEILDDYHWEATLSPLGMPVGICIPADVNSFISVRWHSPSAQDKQLTPHLVAALGNHDSRTESSDIASSNNWTWNWGYYCHSKSRECCYCQCSI